MRSFTKWMWGFSVLAAGLMAVVAAAPAGAVNDEAAFADLRADLEHRLENELAEPGDKATKKQRKAVLKSLKQLDKSSTKMSKDLKIASKCAGFLKKAFADEFTPDVFKLADLGTTFDGISMSFRGQIESGADDADVAAGALGGKAEKKIRKQTSKIGKNIEKAAGTDDYKKRFKSLSKAAKALEKAQKLADKANGSGGGGGGGGGGLDGVARDGEVNFDLDGEPWRSRNNGVLMQYFTGDGGLSVTGVRDRDDEGEDELTILVNGIDGDGRYSLTDLPNVEITYTEKPTGAPRRTFTWDGAGGLIVVDRYDTRRGQIAIRFVFGLTNALDGARAIRNGATSVRGRDLLGSGGSLFNR